MIIWLASYPRSGNTFLRMLLHESFGLKSYSLAGTKERAMGGEPVGQLVGDMNVNWSDELSRSLRADTGRHLVKTHEEPQSATDPCIYVVRDGRSAVVSYHHYLREVDGLDVSLNDVIDGNVYAGSWSDHYLQWQPKTRPNTLFLRYEDITREPDRAVRELAQFFDLSPLRPFSIEFEQLHQMNAAFFRTGENASNIAQLGSAEPRFWEAHGALMSELGYSRAVEE
jgi:hypothetical protein